LKNIFHAWYAPHLLYASETDYNEPNVEPEPELEVAELVLELESETDVIDSSVTESEVVEEPELESKV